MSDYDDFEQCPKCGVVSVTGMGHACVPTKSALSAPTTTSSFTFGKVLMLDEDGFAYKGERIEDAGAAYRALMDALSRPVARDCGVANHTTLDGYVIWAARGPIENKMPFIRLQIPATPENDTSVQLITDELNRIAGRLL